MDIPITPEVAAFIAGGGAVAVMLGYVAVSARHLRIIKGEVTPNNGKSMADRLDAHAAANEKDFREVKDALGLVHRRVDDVLTALVAKGD